MKTSKTILQNIALLTILLIGFISCEKDFASIDSDVINPDNATNFTTDFLEFPVKTYNKNVAPFQTDGLPVNLFGYNNDPVYGNSTVNFVGQMTPTAYNPTFGENVVLDSVVLTIPYFSVSTEIDEDGNSTYELDSIFGNTPIKLSIHKNNFFLRDYDPNMEFGATQKYYSNSTSSSGDIIGASELEGQLLYQDDEFLPSADEIRLTEIALDENGDPILDEDDNLITNVTSRQTPALRVHLDNPNDTFWQNLIFDKEGEPELSNRNNFINHFRGLYLKAEAMGVDGTMMLLNLGSSSTNITIYYTSDVVSDADTGNDNDEIETDSGQFIMNFSGTGVSLYDSNFITIPDGDDVNGDENLYLKGGEGSMAIVELFSGTVEDDNGNQVDALEYFKNSFRNEFDGNTYSQKQLINEAYLEFYVNQDIMEGKEPDRIYIFNPSEETALIDYFLDQSISDTQINAKILHLEPLQRVDDDPDGEGIKYKIRITEHLNNIVIRDSTNAKLGLVVTSNVNTIENYSSKDDDDDGITQIPAGAIVSPRGTVLHGNNTSNEEKKVKLTIYYTEPDN